MASPGQAPTRREAWREGGRPGPGVGVFAGAHPAASRRHAGPDTLSPVAGAPPRCNRERAKGTNSRNTSREAEGLAPTPPSPWSGRNDRGQGRAGRSDWGWRLAGMEGGLAVRWRGRRGWAQAGVRGGAGLTAQENQWLCVVATKARGPDCGGGGGRRVPLWAEATGTRQGHPRSHGAPRDAERKCASRLGSGRVWEAGGVAPSQGPLPPVSTAPVSVL